ncbi:MAG: hypothetical protein CGU29_00600 [Candidatus Dactylopiibacterium carminicum]|uniref:Ancillary SecYEG translocon subunit n=1 Tax=Candidatus Dactylopiibacterium carminicum TaxID=857335 RepID=A0A272EZ23_9RHOO|nr:tetratricopeptide repeat protein [Candidatus Dactylopiibacterium carminicum]KAF7600873.1 hypothetical protein BGI27_00565 [Candidatus Dactylopiibacterium carminicum]PAS95372.1 MAG: hypothetical protein CGU29_00600 [Candidatus Dactylopiibacterium carminicum]PAT00872.1 MAG: hypothetical protein BSR46_00565 [Candidatus Dactylopiibacterium carminicum]
MPAYDLEEQEQLAAIKAWWEKYGNLLTGVALVVALAVSGVQGWRWYSAGQAGKAGALYAAVSQAALAKDADKTRALTDELIDKHGSTLSAELAALQMAQLEVEAGKPDAARAYLERLVDKGSDALLRDLARLRLASLQSDAGDLDAAARTLQATPVPALNARFEDLRGDILFAKGSADEARAAYQRALAAINKTPASAQSQGIRFVVQTKLDALGGA